MTWVCLVGATPKAAEAVTALGRRLMVVAEPESDVPGSGGIPCAVTRRAEAVVLADVADPGAVSAAIDRLMQAHGRPEVVVSFSDLGQMSAATASARLGLRSLPVSVVARAVDKGLMRACLTGTPWDWPYVTGGADDIVSAIEARIAREPWIVKPVRGYGSERVNVLRDTAALRHWAAATTGSDWIAERLASGPEFCVEAVSADGYHRILGITEGRTAGAEDLGDCGHWHLCPAPISGELAADIARATVGMLNVLEIHEGPSHTEVRLDPAHGPVIIETHTRFGGCNIPELIELVTGRDPYTEALAGLLGEDPPPCREPAAPSSCIEFILPPGNGRVVGLGMCEEGLSHAGLHRLDWLAKVGDSVTEARGSDDYVGYVIAVGEDHRQAREAATALAATASIQLAPFAHPRRSRQAGANARSVNAAVSAKAPG